MDGELTGARQTYERLWDEAVSAFTRDALEFDPHLPDKSRDLRLGLSLALRPDRLVQGAIGDFLNQLRAAAHGQYFYRPEELHVTVLALIPGSEAWQDRMQHRSSYEVIIDDVLKRHRKFSIHFRGVTASRGGVMIQGFPNDDTLRQIRDELRESLRRNGLGEQLDVRYKINTAHVTVMRFCDANLDREKLLTLLKANRMTDFGETCAETMELILGDWYASADTARPLQEYKLSP